MLFTRDYAYTFLPFSNIDPNSLAEIEPYSYVAMFERLREAYSIFSTGGSRDTYEIVYIKRYTRRNIFPYRGLELTLMETWHATDNPDVFNAIRGAVTGIYDGEPPEEVELLKTTPDYFVLRVTNRGRSDDYVGKIFTIVGATLPPSLLGKLVFSPEIRFTFMRLRFRPVSIGDAVIRLRKAIEVEAKTYGEALTPQARQKLAYMQQFLSLLETGQVNVMSMNVEFALLYRVPGGYDEEAAQPLVDRLLERVTRYIRLLDSTRLLKGDPLKYNQDVVIVPRDTGRFLVTDYYAADVALTLVNVYPPINEGIYIGRALFSTGAYPLVFNPFVGDNMNMIVTGASGSGKSTLMKLIIVLSSAYFAAKAGSPPMVAVFDPQQEYEMPARLLSAVLGIDYPYVVVGRDRLGLDPVSLAFLRMPGIGEPYISEDTMRNALLGLGFFRDEPELLKYWRLSLDTPFGERVRRARESPGSGDYPTLWDFAEALASLGSRGDSRAEEIGTALKQFYESYERLLTGDPSWILSGRYFIAFPPTLPDNYKRMIVLLVLEPLWGVIRHPRTRGVKKIIAIDEFHQLGMDNPRFVGLVAEMYSQSRKYSASLVTATQAPAAYKALMGSMYEQVTMNSFHKFVLKIEATRPDAELVVDSARVLGLSPRLLFQYSVAPYIGSSVKGVGIYMHGATVIPLRVEVDEEILPFFGSRADEIEKARALLEEFERERDNVVSRLQEVLRAWR